VTGIYRRILAEADDGRLLRSEMDQRRRYLQFWVVAANGETRCGAGAAQGPARVCTEARRKEKDGGILGTRIDAVLSNHVPLRPSSFVRSFLPVLRALLGGNPRRREDRRDALPFNLHGCMARCDVSFIMDAFEE